MLGGIFMFKRLLFSNFIKYVAITMAVLCLPWIVTLSFGQNKTQYIYNTKESGRYVRLDEGKVDVEDFTAYILSRQMDISTEEEALKAQAVIIRTHLYKMMDEENKSILDGNNTEFAYYTYKELEKLWGDDFTLKFNKLMKVVSATSMEVITYNDKVIKPYYHWSSSGNTRDGQSVLGEEYGYLKSVQSSRDVEAKEYLQGVVVEKKEFVRKLREFNNEVSISDEAPLETLQIVERCSGGYISSVQIGNIMISGDEFAYIYSLASPNFQVDEYDGNVRIVTKGSGHGLGLSMYGAMQLAKNGKSYQEILNHYYTDVKIAKVGTK